VAKQMFVARQAQLVELHTFLKRALESMGQVAFVVGEAGSGKTALVTEFASQTAATHDDLVVVMGNCNAQTGIGDPYLPFREILAQLTGDVEGKLAQGALTTEIARRLRVLARWSGNALVELGPDLINILVPGTVLIAKTGRYVLGQAGWLDKLKQLGERKSAGADGSTLDQSHIFEQTTHVLKAVAEKSPLVLVLDDLQWADSASISLLFHLGRRIGESRILVLGAFRPEEVKLGRAGERHPLDKVLTEFKRYYGDVYVDLDQAEKDEAQRFVNDLLDLEPNRLGEEFRQAMVRHTGGHPLFAVELLRAMQEQGDLEKDNEDCWVERARLDWEALPPRVEGVIEERISRLEAGLREILIVGSVEGVEFTAEVIARVRSVDERRLVHSLSNVLDKQHNLVISQGIQRFGFQPLSFYRFRHSLFQKYLYNCLDAVEKNYLHEDVGKALEALYGEQVDEIAVQLAWHFQEANITEKAITYLGQAGEQASQRFANQEAIDHFRRALKLLEKRPPDASRQRTACELSEKLGDKMMLTGQIQEAKTAYEGALRCVPQENLIWKSRLQRKIGKNLERQRYYHKEALRAYDLAETTLKQEPAEPAADWWQEWIAIQVDRIWTLYWAKGPWREMLGLVEKTWSAVQQYGTPAQRSSFYECLVLVENRRYNYVVPEQTVTYAKTSLAASREAGDLGQEARSQFLLGFCHLWRNDLDEAGEAIQSALTLAERIGNVDVQLLCLAYLPVVYRKRGQVEETRRLLTRSLAAARERESIEYEGIARANLAWVALHRGNLTDSRLNAKTALKLWQPPVKVPYKSLALWPLISVGLARNRPNEAIDYARALFEPDQQPVPDELAAVVQKAITAWEKGESEIAGQYLERATQLARELAYL
jgi:tetratricopeptide (TPR) repeat protein